MKGFVRVKYLTDPTQREFLDGNGVSFTDSTHVPGAAHPRTTDTSTLHATSPLNPTNYTTYHHILADAQPCCGMLT